MTLDYSKIPTPEVFTIEKDGYPKGPKRLVCFGPPGVGKTFNMLNGFIQPALTLGVKPSEILSCSYTRAAAGELKSRLVKSSGLSEEELRGTCSTIHSEALKRFRKQFYGQKFTIIGEAKGATDETEASDPQSAIAMMETAPDTRKIQIKQKEAIQMWEYSRNSLIFDTASNEFSKLVYSVVGPKTNLSDMREWISKYEENKRVNCRLDFSDILIKALQCPAPDRKLLVVDEAQDLSLLQWKLIGKWAAKAEHVVVVADPDQAIYGFISANPENVYKLLEFGFSVRRLHQSHRVPKKVHTIARELIIQNTNRIDSPYLPKDVEGSVEEQTIEEACEELDSAAFDEDKDVFVLARSSGILAKWAEVLTNKGVPFINERGISPWGSPIDLAVTRAVMAIRENTPIPTADAIRLVDEMPGRNPKYFNAGVTKIKTRHTLEDRETDGKLSITPKEFEDLCLELTFIRTGNLSTVLEELNLDKRSYSIPRILDNHGTDILYKTPKLRLTTSHSSKGREADLVVVDLEMTRMAKWAIAKDSKVVEEERRLVYVAITRTKNALILVRSPGDFGRICGLPKIPKM